MLFLVLIIALGLFISGCAETTGGGDNGNDQNKSIRLETPTNVSVKEEDEKFILYFDAVEDAEKYQVSLYQTTDTNLVVQKYIENATDKVVRYDLSTMNGGNKFANGIYYVNVKAIASADANQLDSTATKKIQFSVVILPNEFVVSFESNGGSVVLSQTVKKGEMVVKPTDPTKGGYKFLGWYFLDKPYDFNTPVTANFTLVAKWESDGSSPITDLKAYYKSILNSDGTIPTGSALKSKLRTLTTSTHKKVTSYAECKTYLQNADQDPNNKNNMILFYTGESIKKTANMNIWNREHVWAQSLTRSGSGQWFGTSGAGADLHHIRPCDPDVNGSRGNKKFGVGGSYYTPTDEYKGDVARIIFYLMTRYPQSDNLSFTNIAQSKELLLSWNRLDPVSKLEMNRNNYIETIQGNRNPFIDYPKFADMIWS